MVDKTNPDLDEMLDILQEEILAVIGEDAEVRFSKNNRLTNNFSPELAQQQYDKLLANETDIIIAFGSINNEILANQKTYEKPTILFGSISENLIDKPPFNSSVKIENFTSIATVVSYEEDLKILKEITSAKSVGVFIESSFLKTADVKFKFSPYTTRRARGDRILGEKETYLLNFETYVLVRTKAGLYIYRYQSFNYTIAVRGWLLWPDRNHQRLRVKGA